MRDSPPRARSILPIVEGQAEAEALPVLLRRILARLGHPETPVARPFRVKRNRIVRPAELERSIELGVRDRSGVGAILVLLDADDDCPKKLGPDLAKRARRCTRLPLEVVLAQREFESWFLGAKESLRGVRGIRPDAAAPPDPEAIRGAKERLAANMEPGCGYVEVDDQPAMAHRMDLAMAARRCGSFARLMRAVATLARASRRQS